MTRPPPPPPPDRFAGIATSAASPEPTPAQAAFAALTAQVEALRLRLAGWNEELPAWELKRASVVDGQWSEWRALNAALAQFVDSRVDAPGFTRAERQTMRELVCSLAGMLMQDGDDADMRALYERNREPEPGSSGKRRERPAADKAVDSGAGSADESPEAFFERLEAEEHARQQERSRAREEARSESRSARKPRSGSPAHKEQQQAEGASRSLRGVFRKLAGAFHPDRATDAEERQRKTVLMQRTNQAYAAGDLVSLLQLEAEQAEPIAPGSLPDEQLAHFNKALEAQVARLRDELRAVEDSYRRQFGLAASAGVSPAVVMKLLREQQRLLQQDIVMLKGQRQALEDTDFFRRWLREQPLD